MLLRPALAALTTVVALAAGAAADAGPGGGIRPVQVCKSCAARTTAGATFVVTGRGWGHGVGMSQYGALGFARRGLSYGAILGHYYRGTSLAPAPVSRVRVLLGQGLRKLTVSSTRPFRVRDAAGKVHRLAEGEHTFGPGFKLKPEEAERAKALPGPLVFSPGASPLRTRRPYRGSLEVSAVNGKLRVVNVVGIEAYLYGVVPDEMPDTWPPEALKAQAVAARSYAVANRRGGPFDLYADVRSQVYGGIDAESAPATAAVNATAGKVVVYRGRVVSTPYHSTSGGRTAAAADVWPGGKPTPYLVSVPDPHDVLSPHHEWGPLVFSARTLGRRLRVPGALLDVRTTRNPSRRVTSVLAVGSRGEVTVPAADVRRALGLRSTWFHVGVLSLAAPAAPVVYGSALKLTGVVRALSGVSLEHRPAGTGWHRAASVPRAKDGSFGKVVRPRSTTLYRLAAGKVRGQPVLVTVAPRLRLAVGADGATVRGTARPAFPDARVEIQRRSESGWRTVEHAALDQGGRFETTGRLSPGTYRARLSPGRGFVAATTTPVEVR